MGLEGSCQSRGTLHDLVCLLDRAVILHQLVDDSLLKSALEGIRLDPLELLVQCFLLF